MKILIILMLISTYGITKKWKEEFSVGALTYHYFDAKYKDGSRTSDSYANKTSDPKLISNPVLGVRFNKGGRGRTRLYHSVETFIGDDSLGYTIFGIGISRGLRWRYLQLGWVLGSYLYQRSSWEAQNVTHQADVNLGNGYGIIPLIGIEVNPTFPISKHLYFKISNLLTPVLSVHRISIGCRF